MPGPRIALLGFMLEANQFAPVTTGDDFRASCYFVGPDILAEAAKPAPSLPAEINGFIGAMNTAGEWRPVPILVTNVEPGGPADAGFVAETIGRMRSMLQAAGRLDAAYLCNHGAMTATDSTDPDGAFYAMVRQVVGPDVPVVATVDLHANISERMVEAADAIVGYRTNPHVDQAERAAEAAGLIRWLLAGGKLHKRFIRMPIVAPSVCLLTAAGPYADLIARGQSEKPAGVQVVSVVGGFAWSDTPENGLAILTYGDDAAATDALAKTLAEQAWAERGRYNVTLTALDNAVAAAQRRGEDASLPLLCLADVADNPGGGGRGNTTGVLEGLIAANVQGALLGLFVDPFVAAACRAAGVGATLDVTFNEANADEHGHAVAATVEVIALSDGAVIGRRGIVAGRTMNLGHTAAVRLGGVTMVVVSRRIQAADPAFFEHLGLDVCAFRTVVLKSRGHFRAGFDEFFAQDDILEVDAPGLTNPVLSRFPFQRLPRPVYPLNPETTWAGV